MKVGFDFKKMNCIINKLNHVIGASIMVYSMKYIFTVTSNNKYKTNGNEPMYPHLYTDTKSHIHKKVFSESNN